jgi:hypothetical protein
MIRDLIHKLGGPSAVAAWCGPTVNGNAVTAWMLRDHVPWKWRARVRALVEEKGLKLNAREERALSLTP